MPEVKPIPDGYTAITPYLIVEDAAGFLEFLARRSGPWSGPGFRWARA